MIETFTFSKREEIANAITHGIGIALSVAGLVLLIVFAALKGTALHIVTFTIYGVTMTLLYVNSTLLHSFQKTKIKNLFEIFDHGSIYLFIAGTYTPITLVVIQGALGWTLFGIVWGLAIGGIVFKVFFVKKYQFVSTIFYVLMGWMVVFGFGPLLERTPTEGLILLVAGGVLYTIGTIFFVWRGFKYHHAVWHLFVLAGSIAHFFYIFEYVLKIR